MPTLAAPALEPFKKPSPKSSFKLYMLSQFRFCAQSTRNPFYEFDYTFILRKISESCHHDTISAAFLPIKQQFEESSRKTHAVFNGDKRYFTPAFVMGKDLEEYEDTPMFDLEKFNEKVKNLLERVKGNHEHIRVAKPSGRHCQVCHKNYDDYLEHIGQNSHKQKIKCSLGRKYIQDLADRYKKSPKEQALLAINKNVKKFNRKIVKKIREPLQTRRRRKGNSPIRLSSFD